MTVAINPVQRGGGDDLGAIMKAVDIATNLYGAKLDRDRANMLLKLQQQKEAEAKESALGSQQKEEAAKLEESRKEDEKFATEAAKNYAPGRGGIVIPRLAKSFNLPETTTFIPRKPQAAPAAPKDAKATEAEKTAALFGKRMEQSDTILQQLENDAEFDISSLSSSVQRSDKFPDRFKSEKIKSYEQAQRNFINAVLRKESGASISPTEFDSAMKQYFPQDGDSPDLIAQKMENRLLAIEAMKIGSGDYWNKIQIPSVAARQAPQDGTAIAGDNKAPSVVKKFYSPSTRKTKYVYSDGSEQIVEEK